MKATSAYWLFEENQKEILAALYKLVGIGATDCHYKLKTSERGANPRHCREAVTLATQLGEEGMKSIRGKYGKSTKQLLHAATGRPSKKMKISDMHLAEEMSSNILRDLRKASGVAIGTTVYKAGRIKSPESGKAIEEMIVQADKFAAEFDEIIGVTAPVKKAPVKKAAKKTPVKKAAKKPAAKKAPATRKRRVKKAS